MPFRANGLDYFWNKLDVLSFLSQLDERLTVCSYNLQLEFEANQVSLPSRNVYFWCPDGFVCSSSTAECLKVDEFIYPSLFNWISLISSFKLIGSTIFLMILIRIASPFWQYFQDPYESRLFLLPSRRNTPLDRFLCWISFKVYQAKLRWKRRNFPIRRLQTEDLIAVLKKMDPKPTTRFRLTCKAADRFCEKNKKRLAVPLEKLQFDLKFRILT